jgi:hypothetical protein
LILADPAGGESSRDDGRSPISIDQVMIGGLFTLPCIYRFAMEYHHVPHVPMS